MAFATSSEQTETDVRRALFTQALEKHPEFWCLGANEFVQILDNIDYYLQWLEASEQAEDN